MKAIGFDSPEVQVQILAIFEQMRLAITQLAEACQRALEAMREAMQPLIQVVVRWYREACRSHLIPRQCREAMARRKLRRLLLYNAATGSHGSIRRRGSNAPMIIDRWLGEYPNTAHGWRVAELRADSGDW